MKRKVVILGAGISGLALGYQLKKMHGESISLAIYEKSPRPGGWIQTVVKDEFLFELGPRSCRSSGSGADTLRLVEELGLQDEVITGSPDAAIKYLYHEGRVRKFPSNPLSFLFSPLTRHVVPALFKEWMIPKGKGSDESIQSFISRRLNQEIASGLVDPMTSGIYAGDPSQLSMKACFPKVWNWEQQHGSLLKGMLSGKEKKEVSPFIRKIQKAPIFSFRNGMETLTNALAMLLKEELHLQSEVVNLNFNKGGASLTMRGGEIVHADHIFSTLPAHALAPLVPSLQEKLIQIPFATVAVVNLGYHSSVLNKKGFGYLIPSREKEQILGVVWDSSVFPEQNRNLHQTRLTVMIGGVRMPEVENLAEHELIDMAVEALRRHLGIAAPPDAAHVFLARSAIPQYQVGHGNFLAQIEDAAPKNFTCLGSSYRGVSVNDLIKESISHNMGCFLNTK